MVPGLTSYTKKYTMDPKNIDLKQTLNLPNTDFSMKANLPVAEPKMLAEWERENLYVQIRAARAGRPTLRQRHDSPRHCVQQAGQGFYCQVQNHGRLRCALCPGMGLSRPAHRDQSRPRARLEESAHVRRRDSTRLPQVRAEICRAAEE